MAAITDDEVLSCLRRLESLNIPDTGRRALAEIEAVFRWARSRKIVPHTSSPS